MSTDARDARRTTTRASRCGDATRAATAGASARAFDFIQWGPLRGHKNAENGGGVRIGRVFEPMW